MKTPRQPPFLARDSYLRRRVMDVARLLPFVGIFLFALPILWGTGGRIDGGETAREGLYLFAVWAGLILAAWALSARLSAGLEATSEGGDPPRAAPPRAEPDRAARTGEAEPGLGPSVGPSVGPRFGPSVGSSIGPSGPAGGRGGAGDGAAAAPHPRRGGG